MLYSYARLHDNEIWNNQRTLDYLAGDPIRGVPGLASAYTSINRNSNCSTALPLFCDRPVKMVLFNMSFSFEVDNDGTLTYGFIAATLDGQSLSTLSLCSPLYVYSYPESSEGQIRPPVPDLSDSGWVSTGNIPPFPLPSIASTAGQVGPRYIKTSISAGVDCTLDLIMYSDPSSSSLSEYSFDGGLTWSHNSDTTFSALVDSGTGERYSTPAEDDAPWYDPAVPESARFAGLFVEEVTGFDAMTKRDVTDSALLGGTLGPLNYTSRSITVTGWLRAADCCSAEYGLSWLTEALVGNAACDNCAMGDLVMLKCCPPASDADPDPLDYVRMMHRVGLVDGPKVLDRAGTCCGECSSTALKVQFTITSESPYIFSDVDWVLYEDEFTEGPFEYDLTLPCRLSTLCGEDEPVWRPNCVIDIPEPPAPFFIEDKCYCEPWSTMRVGAEFVNSHQWNEVTTYIEIHAGSSSIRNLKLVAFKNARGLDCPIHYEADDDWICTKPCASLAVSEIPSGSKLVIDSRVRSIQLVLAGGQSIPGLRFLSSGEDGSPFDWFDVGPCTSLCLVASVEDRVSSDATISVGLVNRYLASGG